VIFGVDYMIGKLQLNLNNTLFGKTEFQDLDNSYFFFDDKGVANTSGGTNAMEYIKQEFSPAVVTDLNVGYNFTKKFSASFTINNILNVLPSWKLVALNSTGQKLLDNAAQKSLLEGGLTFDGRYQILGYNGSQFSQLGTTFNASLNYKF
jgi:iron complex outermembrane receptor protein